MHLCALINVRACLRAYLCARARACVARSRTLFIAPWDRPPLGRPPRLDGPRRRVSAARARQRAGAAAARRRCRRRHCVRRCRRGSCEERRSAKSLVAARVFYPIYATAATAALPRSARRAVCLLCRCRAPRGPSRGGVGCATAFRPAARPPHCTALPECACPPARAFDSHCTAFILVPSPGIAAPAPLRSRTHQRTRASMCRAWQRTICVRLTVRMREGSGSRNHAAHRPEPAWRVVAGVCSQPQQVRTVVLFP
jgi:hypothetical protein